MRAATITINHANQGQLIKQGSHVDVIWTRTPGGRHTWQGNDKHQAIHTETIAANVLVLAIPRKGSSGAMRSRGKPWVIVEVSPQQNKRLLAASQHGHLSLSLTTAKATMSQVMPTTMPKHQPVTIIRGSKRQQLEPQS